MTATGPLPVNPERSDRHVPAARRARLLFRAITFALLFGSLAVSAAAAQGDVRRGEYLSQAGGCVGCHTDTARNGTPFAGGRVLETPFGTFYGPNITPHGDAGIGRWSEADFMRAMRHGVRPDGAHYYPAFPYPSYTAITDADLRDLWAYLRSLEPNDRASRPHELRFPYRWRSLNRVWKILFLSPGPFSPDPARSQAENRGDYLVNALGHCGECHTPRNVFGALQRHRAFAGVRTPAGSLVPNLTPARLKRWSDADLEEFLQTGTTPDFDAANETMDEVIRNTTSRLTPEDLAAMIAYLRSLPPRPAP
jgi:mono/diheme cytochrome c family protein